MLQKNRESGLGTNPFAGKIKSVEQIKQEEIQEKYTSVLEGNYDKVKELSGNKLEFVPDVGNITKIAITRPLSGGDQLNLIVFYDTEDGKERHITATLFQQKDQNGQDVGVIHATQRDLAPLGVNREELMEAVLEYLKSIKLDYWVSSKKTIIKPGIGETRERQIQAAPSRSPIEIKKFQERLEYFIKNAHSLFGFYEEIKGLNEGYHGNIFPSFAVLENPEYGNATYFVPFGGILDVEKYKKAGVPKEERERIMSLPWTEYLNKSRKELMELVKQDEQNAAEGQERQGFYRIIHRPEDKMEEWAKRMNELIDEILKQSNQKVI
jgi:hypothetical protein